MRHVFRIGPGETILIRNTNLARILNNSSKLKYILNQVLLDTKSHVKYLWCIRLMIYILIYHHHTNLEW